MLPGAFYHRHRLTFDPVFAIIKNDFGSIAFNLKANA